MLNHQGGELGLVPGSLHVLAAVSAQLDPTVFEAILSSQEREAC